MPLLCVFELFFVLRVRKMMMMAIIIVFVNLVVFAKNHPRCSAKVSKEKTCFQKTFNDFLSVLIRLLSLKKPPSIGNKKVQSKIEMNLDCCNLLQAMPMP